VDGYLVDDLSEAQLAVNLVGDLDRARIRERAIARFSVERMVAAYERVYLDRVEARERQEAERPARRPSSVPPMVSVEPDTTPEPDELDASLASA
jgi:hypothetical protein